MRRSRHALHDRDSPHLNVGPPRRRQRPPASALATNRYVGVGGSTTDPSCTDPAHPCELEHAVSEVAAAGDDVTVGPGHYQLPQAVSVDQPMTIHGQADAPRPTLTLGGLNDAPNAGQPELRYLDLDLSSAHMFFGRGVAEQLIVVGGKRSLHRSQALLVFRDNVCVAVEAGSPAVDVETNGGSESLQLSNDTLLATASTGTAIKVATQAAGGSVTVNLLNTIAQGGPAGADILATTLATGTATVNTNHSEYTNVTPSGPGAAINTSITDQHTPPVFVPGSYREAATSVSTIGKGAVDPDNGPFDLDGDLRTTGGVTDIGADQYVTPPSVTALAGSSDDGHGTLTATVDTHGSPTNYLVHYGPTPAYGSASAALSLPASASPAAVSIPLTGLTAGATYHFAITATNSAGTTTTADATFTDIVTPPPPSRPPSGGGTDHPIAPQDSALSFTHSYFAARRVRTTIGARRTRTPFGTLITYTDSQAATTTLTVQRRVRGALHRGRCTAVRAGSHGGRRCWRYVNVGTVTHRDRVGQNRVGFTGSVRGRALSAGHYRMTAVPVSARGLRGRPHTHAFTVVPVRCCYRSRARSSAAR